jgi:hypothetical protein
MLRSGLVVLALALLALTSLAQPQTSLAGSAVYELDTFSATNTTPLDIAGPFLEDGRVYTITVTGTFSYWFAEDWETHGACAGSVTEPMPVFPSPGTTNGRVSGDAAWYFGGPNNLSDCDGPFPDGDDPIGISLDGGINWDGIDVDDRGSAPNPEHTYHLTVIGQGATVYFGIDDEKTEDNYGIFRFTVEPTLVWGNSDCQGGTTPSDVLPIAYAMAGLTPSPNPCPFAVGDSMVTVDFGSRVWGDWDCSGAVDPTDLALYMKYIAGTDPDTPQGCPALGTEVDLQEA